MNDNTKLVAVELAKLAVAADKAVVDELGGAGLIKLAADLFPALVALPKAIGSVEAAIKEVKSLSTDEKKDIGKAIETELSNIPQQNIVPIVDQCVDMLVAFWSLVASTKAAS